MVGLGVAAEIAASGTIPQQMQGFFKASFSNSDQNGKGDERKISEAT